MAFHKYELTIIDNEKAEKLYFPTQNSAFSYINKKLHKIGVERKGFSYSTYLYGEKNGTQFQLRRLFEKWEYKNEADNNN